MLRLMCKKEYGDEFIEMYDMLNSGIPIGDYGETIIVICMIELVRQKYFTKNGHFNPIKYLKYWFKETFKK